MTTQEVRHPIFARLYKRFSLQAETRGQGEHRRELLKGAAGRVIEVGAGNGLNFAHYPATVTEVVAVEPEPVLREEAVRASLGAESRIEVIDGLAGSLPGEDRSFDVGVASLVLCSVPEQGSALSELFRVIRPGGELRFYEHVVADRPNAARLMRIGDTLWPRVSGGCHMSRDTARGIEGVGFEIESCGRFAFSPSKLMPAVPHILGVARRP
ncbi:MAG: class I SAM-dependent methyltransferase [Actinomycetota bacterium]|nr:class I SAM-dependent methyltransferase [Actinomycetota bacterium]